MTGDELPAHIFFFFFLLKKRAKAHSVLMCSNLASQRVVTIMTHISGPGGVSSGGKAGPVILCYCAERRVDMCCIHTSVQKGLFSDSPQHLTKKKIFLPHPSFVKIK